MLQPKAPSNSWLTRTMLRRLAASLILAEQEDLVATGQLERGALAVLKRPAARHNSFDAVRIDESGLGFDSLSRLSLILRFNRFFYLNDTGIEDYLLTATSLGEWVTLLDQHLRAMGDGARFSFATSGSAGPAKHICHSVGDLVEEVHSLQRRLQDWMRPNGRFLALVPPHHIYGFLFTCLLPKFAGMPVVDLHHAGPCAAFRHARSGDVLIGTPFVWRTLCASGLTFAHDVLGVTSAGAACSQTWSTRDVNGLGKLIEIYGSTETGGIGTRSEPGAAFELLDHLCRANGNDDVIADGKPPKPLQDKVEWLGPRQFRLQGRRDDVVKVGGVNVSPSHVEAVLRACEGVSAASVRLAGDRMKAFVVPRPGIVLSTLEVLLNAHMRRHLQAPARPVQLTFGAELPVNAMGKICDWDAAPSG